MKKTQNKLYREKISRYKKQKQLFTKIFNLKQEHCIRETNMKKEKILNLFGGVVLSVKFVILVY